MVSSHTNHAPAAAQPDRPERLDARALETLVGYNARRAWLVVSAAFSAGMAVHGLKPAGFSVLLLLARNPGATSRQLSATLDILPPNLVQLITTLERRDLVERHPHPHDRRAAGLHLTQAGKALLRKAERSYRQIEAQTSARLTADERQTLIGLLRKMYRAV